MSQYKNVGDHVYDVASGAMVGVGETIELSDKEQKDPFNDRLITSGTFIMLSGTTEPKAEPQKKSKATAKLKEGEEV